MQEKRAVEWVSRTKEESAGRIRELEGALVAINNRWEILAIHTGEMEKEVDHLKVAAEATEKKCHEVLVDRAMHVKLLTKSY